MMNNRTNNVVFVILWDDKLKRILFELFNHTNPWTGSAAVVNYNKHIETELERNFMVIMGTVETYETEVKRVSR